jgi:MFS family permease
VVALSASAPRAAGGHVAERDVVDKGLPRSGLVVLTIGGGLAAAASTSLGVFLVDAGVDAGLGPGESGLLFAVSSVLGLVGRVGMGWLADRYPRRSLYLTIATLLTVGAAGYALLAAGAPAPFVAGSLLAYGAGWTWTGLFHYAIVKDNRLTAAAATGFVQTGLSLGAALGPLAFGVVASATSYRTAWLWNAVLTLVAAVTIRGGRRIVRRHRGLPVVTLRLHRVRPASAVSTPPPLEEDEGRWQTGWA